MGDPLKALNGLEACGGYDLIVMEGDNEQSVAQYECILERKLLRDDGLLVAVDSPLDLDQANSKPQTGSRPSLTGLSTSSLLKTTSPLYLTMCLGYSDSSRCSVQLHAAI